MSNPPPIMTIWNSSENKIKDAQVLALRKLLKFSGAISTKKLSNGAIVAKFASWKAMEKANKDIITPLQTLFMQDDIDMTYGNPFSTIKKH
jgi:hypothetical protein